ncbi:MAG: hypothetical protein ACK42K_01360 [Leptonema sp. (in: bacteria)]
MHKSTLKLFILFFLLNLSCNLNTNISKELNQYYEKGEFLKILETIQVYESKNSKENPDLYLWKARMYSIYPESYDMAKYFYQKYIKLNPKPESYYEYTLFLIDISEFLTIQELISGENIDPNLIFHPIINDIRNFLECRSKTLEERYNNIFLHLEVIKDLYLFNYCYMLLYSDIYHKIIFKNLQNTNPETYKNLSTTEELNRIQDTTLLLKYRNQNLFSIKELIHLYKEKNSGTLNKEKRIYCSLQQHFPDFKISAISIEECKKNFPYNLTLFRKVLKTSKRNKISVPLFDNKIYSPTYRN